MRSARFPSGPRLRLEPGGGQATVPLTDEELIDAFERGEGASVDAIYDRLVHVVDGTLLRVMGRREHDHADLVQAAFEQIVLTLSRGTYARACSLGSWAAAISTHVALKALRARINERRVVDVRPDALDGAAEPAAPNNVEREASTREAFERLRLHLAAMDPGKALTVYLHDGLGHDLAEIAALTNVSVAAAQSRLVRGRQELRARMTGPPLRKGRREGEP